MDIEDDGDNFDDVDSEDDGDNTSEASAAKASLLLSEACSATDITYKWFALGRTVQNCSSSDDGGGVYEKNLHGLLSSVTSHHAYPHLRIYDRCLFTKCHEM